MIDRYSRNNLSSGVAFSPAATARMIMEDPELSWTSKATLVNQLQSARPPRSGISPSAIAQAGAIGLAAYLGVKAGTRGVEAAATGSRMFRGRPI